MGSKESDAIQDLLLNRIQGVCPRQELLTMIEAGIIKTPQIEKGQLQPASLDLRIGDWAKCITASFSPDANESIEKTLEREGISLYDFPLSETSTNVLERGRTYLVPLQESLALDKGFTAVFNPKSTTGRADLLTRVLSEGCPSFDLAPSGKERKLYLQITPQSFNVRIKKGLSLSQMRISYGNSEMDEAELKIAHRKYPLLYSYDEKPIPELEFENNGIALRIDLQSPIVAYRARNSSQLVLDLTKGRGSHFAERDKFWETIEKPKDGRIVIEPGAFYLLSTAERTSMPPDICGALDPYMASSIEGRNHLAGWAEDGFGFEHNGERICGTPLTEELRSHAVIPEIFTGEKRIGLLKGHRVRKIPVDEQGNRAIYGSGIYGSSSNYQKQVGPTMGKQFLEPK